MKIKVHAGTNLKVGRSFYAYSETGRAMRFAPIQSMDEDKLILQNGAEVFVTKITEDEWMELLKEGDFYEPEMFGY